MILTVEEQRAVEMRAVASGMTLGELMETAGQRAFSQIRNQRDVKGLPVVVLAGNGGNGGDGFVVARLLKKAGANPVVVLCSGTPKANAPSLMYKRAVMDGVPFLDWPLEQEQVRRALAEARLVVDGVYGIGFHGNLNAEMRALFDIVNEQPCAVAALDMPSGVNADTGFAAECAVVANETVAFIAKKPAHILKRAETHCGAVTVADIGIPDECFAGAGNRIIEIDRNLVRGLLSPKSTTAHKGDCGRLLLAVGSERYRGAAVLSAMGAYAAGAGVVTVASRERVLAAVAAQLPEAVLFDVEHDGARYAEQLACADAVAIGCGLSVSPAIEKLLYETVGAACPLLIDADGLNILCETPELLDTRKGVGETVLTPHVGEFARLAGRPVEEVLADEIGHARRFAVRHGVVLVLKDASTAVALPDGQVFVNSIGNAGLAKAGSGDLLAGMIAALLGMKKTAADAAVAGVYLHALAADIASADIDAYAMMPSAVAKYVSAAYRLLFAKENEN